MSKQVDLKSFIIGVLVTFCITLVMGSAGLPINSSDGRFEIIARDNHVYVLDSTNGRVWESFSPSASGRTSQNFHAEKLSPDATDKD